MEISSEYSLEGLMLKLQYFSHLMWKTDTFEKILRLGKVEGRRRRGRQRLRSLDGITDSRDMSFNKFWELVKDREAWYAEVHGVSKSWTWLRGELNWTELNWYVEKQSVVFTLKSKGVWRKKKKWCQDWYNLPKCLLICKRNTISENCIRFKAFKSWKENKIKENKD